MTQRVGRVMAFPDHMRLVLVSVPTALSHR